MKPSRRWVREIVFFLSVAAVAMVVLPLLLAALAYQSRQAMFWPAYEALYTYFLRYTVLAAVVTAGFAVLIRFLVSAFRGRHSR